MAWVSSVVTKPLTLLVAEARCTRLRWLGKGDPSCLPWDFGLKRDLKEKEWVTPARCAEGLPSKKGCH